MDNATLERLAKQLEPGQEFKITYVSPIKCTASFRDLSGGCTLGKMTGVTTVTGLNYYDLDSVKQKQAEREAAIAAGTAEPVGEAKVKYESIIPHTLCKQEGKDEYALCLYPTECWKDKYSTYCIFTPAGEIQAQYEDWNDIRDYALPSWVKQQERKDRDDFPPIIRKKASTIYDIVI